MLMNASMIFDITFASFIDLTTQVEPASGFCANTLDMDYRSIVLEGFSVYCFCKATE